MVKINADNDSIHAELETLVRLVTDNGGWLHPEMTIACRNNNFTIETDTDTSDAEALVNLPFDLLIPMPEADVDENLNLSLPANEYGQFTDIQYELAQSLFRLYNMTEKLKGAKEYSFWLALAAYPDIAEHILKARRLNKKLAGWWEALNNAPSPQTENQVLAEIFIKSRTISLDKRGQVEKQPFIMPVIDFLNHHWQGAPFMPEKHGALNCLVVQVRHPLPASKECFAFYALMDELDSLFRYDFFDATTPLLRSVPLTLDFEELGSIHIQGEMGVVNNNRLEKSIADLRLFLPVLAKDNKMEGNHFTASHLILPGKEAPFALRRTLATLINSLSDAPLADNKIKALVSIAEAQILKTNHLWCDELEALINVAQTQGAPTPREKEALALFQKIASSRKEKLDRYESLLAAAA